MNEKGSGAPAAGSPRHTPGPWVIFNETDSYPGIVGPDGTCVIVVWGDETDNEAGVRGPTHETALANARLIAAAPALSDALEAMLLNARSHKDCPRSLPSLPVAQAEAALRAAGRLP